MPELGTKHECLDCGAKFYDLGRPEVRCPRCGADQTKPKPDKNEPAAEVVSTPEAELDEPELEVEPPPIDEDEETLEDLPDEDEDDELLEDEILADD